METQYAKVVATVAALTLLLLTLGYVIYVVQTVRNRVSVGSVNVDLYWDGNLTMPLGDAAWIDWGTMGPGMVKSTSLYVYNPGSLPANVSVFTSDWDPENITEYVWLNWTMLISSAPLLPPGNNSELVLSLNVNRSIAEIMAPGDTVDFLFNITVVGKWLPPG